MELMQWLSKLMPKQKMQDVGDGCIQVGSVGGDLTHSQKTMTQTIYNNTIYVMAGGQPAANENRPASSMETQPPATEKRPATSEQLEVLRIMRMSSAAREYAEAFMQRHFNTIRVKSLDDLQCKRTRRWVETCIENDAQPRPDMRRVG